MTTIEEKLNSTGVNSGAHTLLEEMKLLKEMQDHHSGVTQVRGKITGLKPGPHGFHIHALGDTTSDSCGGGGWWGRWWWW
ncbi:putative superoxide dismutase [Helianthus debilis subsp. tardiflorus]